MGIIKNLILFLIMSIVYFLIEFIYRGSTFLLMGFIGGTVGILIGLINEYIDWDTPLWKQGIYAVLVVITLEFISGMIFNKEYIYWDYRNEFMNLNGMICLKYSIYWYPVGLFAIILDDLLRAFLFKEEFKGYKLF